MNFFKSFLASFLALTIFSILSCVLLFVIMGILAADEKVEVRDKSVLHLKLDAQISEQQIDNPFEGLFGNDVPKIGLLPLKETIRYAKSDPKIEGIFLNVSYPMTGFSTIEEIRQSLLDFRESGKWVVAYSEIMSERAYYLASAADQVYLNPEGEVEFNGLTIEITFFKKMLNKLEIKPEIFRVGEYKSAVEPFILEKMSNENRLQLSELANSVYEHVLEKISIAREVPKERLEEISDKMLARTAKLTVKYGLVDSLLYYDEVLAELKRRVGVKENGKVQFIRYNKYRKSFNAYKSSPNEVAVIVAEGTILPGSADQDVIGSDTFAEEIRRARENKKVKAIVIRVNSPGGSFQASDVMWREVTLAAKEKPVIASMSDYAASGGYYLSMGCDTIVAQPHTITGSIGVFSVLFDASGFLGNKLGITSDEVRTGDYGELVTISRPLSDAEKNVWQSRTDEIYETFTGKAATGRDMTQDNIKKVASGRVWTGVQAKERGLVDVLGGYDDAVQIAAEAAGVSDDFRVKFYPVQKSFFEQLVSTLEENAKVNGLKEELGENYLYYRQWKALRQFNGAQARMPFELKMD